MIGTDIGCSDAPQLAKHLLAARTWSDSHDRQPVKLMYAFWEPLDPEGFPASQRHRSELDLLFARLEGAGVELTSSSLAVAVAAVGRRRKSQAARACAGAFSAIPRRVVRPVPSMTLAARSLLGAADSRRHKSEPEDRLTEILREVLMTAPALTSWLLKRGFGLSEPEAARCCGYGDYEVATQFPLRGGGRPDMRIRFCGHHLPPGVLFCENKIFAGWTKLQLAGYPSVPESDRIVVLSPSGMRRPNESSKFVPLSWTELARAADEIGRLWEGLDWRKRAVTPDAPGQCRVLAEFLWYLEREEGVDVSVTRPVTASDLGLLPDVNAVVARWHQFRRLVRGELQRKGKPPIEQDKGWDPESQKNEKLAFRVTVRQGSGWDGANWPAMSRALAQPKSSWQELILAPQAPWMNQAVPFIAVGVGLHRLPDWSEGMDEWSRLQDTIKGTGAWLGFTNREKDYRVLMARPLAEIGPKAQTLEAQAEDAAEWALTALDGLLDLEAAD